MYYQYGAFSMLFNIFYERDQIQHATPGKRQQTQQGGLKHVNQNSGVTGRRSVLVVHLRDASVMHEEEGRYAVDRFIIIMRKYNEILIAPPTHLLLEKMIHRLRIGKTHRVNRKYSSRLPTTSPLQYRLSQ